MRGLRTAGLGFVIAVGAMSQVPADAASKSCGGPVRFERDNGSFTTSVAIRGLRANGTSCRRARHIATVAAKAMLRNGIDSVPAIIDGYRIVVPESCSSCAPSYPVSAKKADARVKFRLDGGG